MCLMRPDGMLMLVACLVAGPVASPVVLLRLPVRLRIQLLVRIGVWSHTRDKTSSVTSVFPVDPIEHTHKVR